MSVFGFFKNANERLAANILSLEEAKPISSNWLWEKKEITALYKLNESIINDLDKLYKKKRINPSVYGSLSNVLKQLHNELYSMIHYSISDPRIQEEKAKSVNNLVAEVKTLFKQKGVILENNSYSKLIAAIAAAIAISSPTAALSSPNPPDVSTQNVMGVTNQQNKSIFGIDMPTIQKLAADYDIFASLKNNELHIDTSKTMRLIPKGKDFQKQKIKEIIVKQGDKILTERSSDGFFVFKLNRANNVKNQSEVYVFQSKNTDYAKIPDIESRIATFKRMSYPHNTSPPSLQPYIAGILKKDFNILVSATKHEMRLDTSNSICIVSKDGKTFTEQKVGDIIVGLGEEITTNILSDGYAIIKITDESKNSQVFVFYTNSAGNSLPLNNTEMASYIKRLE